MTQRWSEVLSLVTYAVAPGPSTVVVDGTDAEVVADTADRLAATLREAAAVRREGATIDVEGGGPRVVVWLRTSRDRHAEEAARGDHADIVVDLHDRAWPVVRHVAPHLAEHQHWYLRESRAFFGVRAATWDTKFGDDAPAYAAAVCRAGLPIGGTVLDAGCGTGRALPALRDAVGPAGTVIGLDVTAEMLDVARTRGEHLVMGDARRLPFATGALDAIFAAGLVMHLPDAAEGLRELARATCPGGRLVLFHPSGRARLAARHGRTLRPDEPLAVGPLTAACEASGWALTDYDDGEDRFFALAVRHARPRETPRPAPQAEHGVKS
ncbi:class I SAM-dependent methyltransferase [Dactylosporangium sp. CS-033363]|uniref:class I SAM-dependent methyltransferase n=1 Tax=Dactylosporangium sp. CS-033363 TaxID=3239935 RepID=UPI003D8B9A5C